MTTRTRVWCTTQFEGFHCWPDAPDEVAFLRARHRHIFHVKCWKEVTHNDRDIEFILMKRHVNGLIKLGMKENNTENWSCEMWAHYLLQAGGFCKVNVDEDKENGAEVETDSNFSFRSATNRMI